MVWSTATSKSQFQKLGGRRRQAPVHTVFSLQSLLNIHWKDSGQQADHMQTQAYKVQ